MANQDIGNFSTLAYCTLAATSENERPRPHVPVFVGAWTSDEIHIGSAVCIFNIGRHFTII